MGHDAPLAGIYAFDRKVLGRTVARVGTPEAIEGPMRALDGAPPTFTRGLLIPPDAPAGRIILVRLNLGLGGSIAGEWSFPGDSWATSVVGRWSLQGDELTVTADPGGQAGSAAWPREVWSVREDRISRTLVGGGQELPLEFVRQAAEPPG